MGKSYVECAFLLPALLKRVNTKVRKKTGLAKTHSLIIEKEGGQTLGEYILILLLIAIVAIVVLGFFGNRLAALFQSVVGAF